MALLPVTRTCESWRVLANLEVLNMPRLPICTFFFRSPDSVHIPRAEFTLRMSHFLPQPPSQQRMTSVPSQEVVSLTTPACEGRLLGCMAIDIEELGCGRRARRQTEQQRLTTLRGWLCQSCDPLDFVAHEGDPTCGHWHPHLCVCQSNRKLPHGAETIRRRAAGVG